MGEQTANLIGTRRKIAAVNCRKYSGTSPKRID